MVQRAFLSARMIRFPWLCSVTALLLLIPGTTSAAPILDQSFQVSNGAGPESAFSVATNQSLAQTFTVGITGLLTFVEAQIYNNRATEPLVYEIVQLSGGLPAGVLTSGQLPSANAPAGAPVVPAGASYPFTTLEFPDVFVTAGTQLALVLRQPIVGSPYAWFWADDGYSSGRALVNNTGAWTGTGSVALDLGFRTYVETQQVPEPASLALLALGLAGVGRRHWRRRQAS